MTMTAAITTPHRTVCDQEDTVTTTGSRSVSLARALATRAHLRRVRDARVPWEAVGSTLRECPACVPYVRRALTACPCGVAARTLLPI
ncbi:hypothetical protein X777_05560 [Ooceraea biroi]|uniref:Uncharacterized protein n=1 Tax=Ooceraea biroi TaxID=2015173 RepID=A0A026WE00_OOCBI|nr:hypothetical protein X777_05560 [Ooceraea biroi]